MKIAVTGGAGFIASHIVDAYITDGHDVVILDNMSSGKKENINAKAKFYNVDVCGAEIEKIFEIEQPEILNHHAAQIDVRKSVDDPAFDCRVNILGFLSIMEAARKTGVKKIIFSSSGGAIYGEQENFPAYEDHATNPVSPYGVAKFACEKYLHYYYTQYGIPYIIFRYANIYGPRQNPHGEAGVVAIFINNILNGVQSIIYGDGKNVRDWLHVDDHNNAVWMILNKGVVGSTYNISGENELDNLCLVNLLCEKMAKITDRNRNHYKKLISFVVDRPGHDKRYAVNSDKIKKELGWKRNVPFEKGIEETITWYLKNKEWLDNVNR